MASKAKSSSSLKQRTLPFASAKRGSTAAGKTGSVKASPTVVKPSSREKREPGSRTASIGSTISINTTTTGTSSDDEVELVAPATEQRSVKRRKVEPGQAGTTTGANKNVRKALKNDSDSSSDEDEEPRELQDLGVLEKDPRIQRLYKQARARMGDANPVHAKDQNKIYHVLRVFDTSYEYGPCVGMTRLERWERAHALGLNPPPEVREILSSKQGLEEDAYRQSVFYDEL